MRNRQHYILVSALLLCAALALSSCQRKSEVPTGDTEDAIENAEEQPADTRGALQHYVEDPLEKAKQAATESDKHNQELEEAAGEE